MAASQIPCPHCHNTLEVQSEWAGMNLSCPACNQTFVCPQVSAPVPPAFQPQLAPPPQNQFAPPPQGGFTPPPQYPPQGGFPPPQGGFPPLPQYGYSPYGGNEPPANMFTALKKYAQFSGRASRREYWLFAIFNNILCIIAAVVAGLAIADDNEDLLALVGVCYIFGALFLVIPNISVAVRRCHDVGKSGWWILTVLIPCVGWIFYLMAVCAPSQLNDNQYGPNPNGSNPDEAWPVVVGIALAVIFAILNSLGGM